MVNKNARYVLQRVTAFQLRLKPCPHWRLISATETGQFVAEFGDSPKTATVAEFGDYSRQCGQGYTKNV